MTIIDRISFRFGMADEQFARELYADWDRFCCRCVTDILEFFFDRYDTKDTYVEIDRLDLDLGGIKQDEFYEVFPVRLREALERSFIQKLNEIGRSRLESTEGTDSGMVLVPYKSSPYAKEKRFGNLLHYLEYGFCLPEWNALEFDLYAELLQFSGTAYTERMLSLLASKPYVLERLFLQTGAERFAEVIPFTLWLSSSVLGRHEKQRYLSSVLEYSPRALIRFIHGTEDAGSVEEMAELLENPHIRHIMAAEAEDHAEIGVPEYWYRLYCWLFEYYPFNGVPMFGDKRHFRLHLNRRLLSFIRKRNYQAYISKSDLTIRFLLEVFGADHYVIVLNIIYRNHPFDIPNEFWKSIEQHSQKETTAQSGKMFYKWADWLLSPSVSDTEKSQMLQYYARWKPKLLWEFVRYSTNESSGKKNIPFYRWNTLMDTKVWLEMVSGVSFSLSETLHRAIYTMTGKQDIAGTGLAEGLVRLISAYPADRILGGNSLSVVMLGNCQSDKEFETTLQPEYVKVPNAGLCLLSIWFLRLFDMLGLLVANTDGKKDFKDIEARIRAVFILQRLVTDEVREYEEHELAFNRILTGCPFYVPLPKTLELTRNEIQIVESMLAGVKANWDKLKNTSIKGFQHSFIERSGKLEQRDDKWVLYVDERAYDILLDSLPWSYSKIRLPWFRKNLNIVWRHKEKLDF